MGQSIVRCSFSDVLLVARQWMRRGSYTSVERFLDFFPQAQITTSGDEFRRPYRLYKWLSERIGQNSYTSFSTGLELAAVWRAIKYRPAVVHFLYADHDLYYAGKILEHVRDIRTVGTFWFSIEEFETRMPDKSHLSVLDLVTASGQAQKEYLRQYVDDAHLANLPLGVDADFFRPPDDATIRWKKPLRVLQVGINRRDFKTLHAVFIKLQRRIPGIKLDMIGCTELQEMFTDLDDVTFHPLVSDEELRRLYQEAAVMVLPLLEGGSSNALNEALACGLPVVTTEMPNLRDYADEDSVVMCPVKDAEAMATAVGNLLEDRRRWERASDAARQQALTYDWKVIRERLVDLYRERLGVELIDV